MDQINAAGGVLGAKLQVITEDDGSNMVQGPTLIKKLAGQPDIVVLTELSSSVLIQSHPLFEQYKISVAHAAFMGIGAYAAGVMTRNFEFLFIVALLIGGAASGIPWATTGMR